MDTNMAIAVDLAKAVFEIAVADGHGRTAERQRLSRARFQRFFQNQTPATVVMEACGTSPVGSDPDSMLLGIVS